MSIKEGFKFTCLLVGVIFALPIIALDMKIHPESWDSFDNDPVNFR